MRHQEINGVIIPTPESYRDCFLLAQSDYYRYYGRKVGLLTLMMYSIISPYFSFNFYLRMCSYRKKTLLGGGIFGCCKLIKTYKGRRRCLMISEQTTIGYGLYLAHAFGVIINPKAVIGNNCTISQFTTVGAMYGQAATIGDNVYMGPSVCVVENVKIGNGSVIGAGAVVVKDVPANKTFAGVPAKVISDNNSSKLITNPWIIEK